VDSIARNEGLLRTVNQQIERLSTDLDDRSWTTDGRIEFHCECGNGCDARLRLSPEEYDRVHQERDRFVVAHGHESPEIEVVVERNERYAVVDKLPSVEPLVGADGVPRSG